MREVLADVLIAGGGPAGLTAAIYARRAGLSAVIVERLYCGGQVTATADIDNYPGLPGINGMELAMKMEAQAKALGARIINADITGFDFSPGSLAAVTKSGRLEAQSIILAMGARRRKLNIEGEDSFLGRGVSYCATCDGNFFKGKDVAVVGGGNTALEDALYLSGLCNKVYLIHRRDEFRGGRMLETAVRRADNIELALERVPVKIEGSSGVEKLTVAHVKTGAKDDLLVSAVFVAVGTEPESGLLEGLLPLNPQGRVLAGENCKTAIPGVFAAGDLREKPLFQIVTAAADGAAAATAAFQFLQEL